jgi:hypothetical protein
VTARVKLSGICKATEQRIVEKARGNYRTKTEWQERKQRRNVKVVLTYKEGESRYFEACWNNESLISDTAGVTIE